MPVFTVSFEQRNMQFGSMFIRGRGTIGALAMISRVSTGSSIMSFPKLTGLRFYNPPVAGANSLPWPDRFTADSS